MVGLQGGREMNECVQCGGGIKMNCNDCEYKRRVDELSKKNEAEEERDPMDWLLIWP